MKKISQRSIRRLSNLNGTITNTSYKREGKYRKLEEDKFCQKNHLYEFTHMILRENHIMKQYSRRNQKHKGSKNPKKQSIKQQKQLKKHKNQQKKKNKKKANQNNNNNPNKNNNNNTNNDNTNNNNTNNNINNITNNVTTIIANNHSIIKANMKNSNNTEGDNKKKKAALKYGYDFDGTLKIPLTCTLKEFEPYLEEMTEQMLTLNMKSNKQKFFLWIGALIHFGRLRAAEDCMDRFFGNKKNVTYYKFMIRIAGKSHDEEKIYELYKEYRYKFPLNSMMVKEVILSFYFLKNSEEHEDFVFELLEETVKSGIKLDTAILKRAIGCTSSTEKLKSILDFAIEANKSSGNIKLVDIYIESILTGTKYKDIRLLFFLFEQLYEYDAAHSLIKTPSIIENTLSLALEQGLYDEAYTIMTTFLNRIDTETGSWGVKSTEPLFATLRLMLAHMGYHGRDDAIIEHYKTFSNMGVSEEAIHLTLIQAFIQREAFLEAVDYMKEAKSRRLNLDSDSLNVILCNIKDVEGFEFINEKVLEDLEAFPSGVAVGILTKCIQLKKEPFEIVNLYTTFSEVHGNDLILHRVMIDYIQPGREDINLNIFDIWENIKFWDLAMDHHMIYSTISCMIDREPLENRIKLLGEIYKRNPDYEKNMTEAGVMFYEVIHHNLEKDFLYFLKKYMDKDSHDSIFESYKAFAGRLNNFKQRYDLLQINKLKYANPNTTPFDETL